MPGRMVWREKRPGVKEMVWDPEAPEKTPEELAKKIDGSSISVRTWNPESTTQAAGRPMGQAEWEAWKKKRGYVEVDKGDTGERRAPRPTLSDIKKKSIEEAKEFLLKTQQAVPAGTPITERTKALLASGQAIVRLPSPAGDDTPDSTELGADPAPSRPTAIGSVDGNKRGRLPWGYTGSKEDLIAGAKKLAAQKMADRAS